MVFGAEKVFNQWGRTGQKLGPKRFWGRNGPEPALSGLRKHRPPPKKWITQYIYHFDRNRILIPKKKYKKIERDKFFFLVFKNFNFFLQNLVPYSILIKNQKRFLKSVHNFSIYIYVFDAIRSESLRCDSSRT